MGRGREARARVEALAAEGHAQAARRKRRRRLDVAWPFATSEADARARERLLALGLFDRAGLVLVVVLAVVATLVLLHRSPTLGGDDATFVLGAASAVTVGVFAALRGLRGLGIVARERRRVAALPFAVEGWEALLETAVPVDGRLVVALEAARPEALDAAAVRSAGLAIRTPGELVGAPVTAAPKPGVPPSMTAYVVGGARALALLASQASRVGLRRARLAVEPTSGPGEGA